jgi:hypothetical protein
MNQTRTIRDPFLGKDVEISSRLIDRLRGQYACGPTLPSGEPEFGWRFHDTPPIQHEAAKRIERLQTAMFNAINRLNRMAGDSRSMTRLAFREGADEIAKELATAYNAAVGQQVGDG